MIKRYQKNKEIPFIYGWSMIFIPLLMYTAVSLIRNTFDPIVFILLNMNVIILFPIMYYFINKRSFGKMNMESLILRIVVPYAIVSVIADGLIVALLSQVWKL